MKEVCAEYFGRSAGPSKVGVFSAEVLPQLSALLKSALEAFSEKDGEFLEEFRLSFERERQKNATLESMVRLQRENLAKVVSQDRQRREHDEAVFKERQQLEREKWKAFQGETQKLYHEFESSTAKSGLTRNAVFNGRPERLAQGNRQNPGRVRGGGRGARSEGGAERGGAGRGGLTRCCRRAKKRSSK